MRVHCEGCKLVKNENTVAVIIGCNHQIVDVITVDIWRTDRVFWAVLDRC